MWNEDDVALLWNLKTSDIILTIMCATGQNVHTSGHLQKLVFLIHQRVDHWSWMDTFHFEPGPYGPFDIKIEETLCDLQEHKKTHRFLHPRYGYAVHTPTIRGFKEGIEMLKELPTHHLKEIRKLSRWALQLSFSALVGAVVREYPAMDKNMVFKN